jgi:ElaB/YqjD/DUF883 family membrane-anchored ribosome-binding protein
MTTDPHPGMMGDGTEEQNLGQPGDPSARITEGEVDAAFDSRRADEPRAFSDSDAPSDIWINLKERAASVREHVADTADSLRDWAVDQAAAAKQTAAKRPVLAISASAGTALAVGLALGFLLGRASAE